MLLISIHRILLMLSVKQQTIFQKQHSLKYQKPYLHLKKKIAYLKKLQQVPTIKMKTKTKGAIQMKITYTQVGEQLYPNLIMPTKTEQMGYYAQKRQEYLKNHKKATFTTLLTTCKLTEHLMSIQEQAQQMEEQIITQMAKAQGVTEKLKQTNMMTWVGMMNNIKNSARETVLNELIYTM
ncbi:MAG: TnpV protein [Eubacterium sp.]|uniref:TnpV protein n=2 Tax=Eubacteriales TaxID=186802 RepID=UPI0039A1BF5D